MSIIAQVEDSGTAAVGVTKNQPKVAGGSWKPLPVPVVNADSLSNSVPRTEEKWNIYDVFGSPKTSGLLVMPPRVSVVPIKGTELESVGPSASIKGDSKSTPTAEYDWVMWTLLGTSRLPAFSDSLRLVDRETNRCAVRRDFSMSMSG